MQKMLREARVLQLLQQPQQMERKRRPSRNVLRGPVVLTVRSPLAKNPRLSFSSPTFLGTMTMTSWPVFSPPTKSSRLELFAIATAILGGAKVTVLLKLGRNTKKRP